MKQVLVVLKVGLHAVGWRCLGGGDSNQVDEVRVVGTLVAS
jgi:hypothetical protein